MTNKKSSKLSKKLMAVAIGSTVAGASSQILAQPKDTRATEIEEVIVTAQRVEESLQETPVSVAAFGSEELEQLGVSEAGDVGKFAPNLEMRKQSASQDNYAIAIRGVASGETALAVDPTVGVYVDGIYIARSTGLAFDIVDLKRIEVLRGPQGTLFGRNTIGGAINIVTEKPSGELAFRQDITTGARNYRKYKTTIDFDKVGDVAAKLSFLRTMKDGQWESVYTGRELGANSATAMRLGLNWTPTDTISVDYAYEKSDRESNAATQQLTKVRDVYADDLGGLNPYYGGPFYDAAEAAASPDRKGKLALASSNSDDNSSDIDSHSIIFEWDWTENSTVKSITNYREWDSVARATEFGTFAAGTTVYDINVLGVDPYFTTVVLDDIAGYDFNGDGETGANRDDLGNAPLPASSLGPNELVSLFSAQRVSSQHQFSQEFQVVGTLLEEKLRYNVGLYYFEEKADEDNPQSFILPANVILTGQGLYDPINDPLAGRFGLAGYSFLASQPSFSYQTDNQSYAIYGQFTYVVGTDLDVTFGYRYTVDKKETTLTNGLDGVPGDPTTFTFPVSPQVKTLVNDDKWTNFNPSVTVDYRWSDLLSTYAKVATGYRSGGFNVRSSTSAAFNDPFDEENITSYEIGWKSDLFNRRLRFNGAVFHIDYEDRQIAQFEAGSGGASNTIVNAGEQSTDGLEFEAIYIPFTGMRVMAGYAYLDVDFEEFITARVNTVTGFPTNPGVNEDIADSALENVYAPQHSGSAAIDYQFAPWEFGQLGLRVDATYSDEVSFHPQFNLYDESDDYYLLNARATLSNIRVGDDGTLRLALWGKNLENKEYRDFGIDFGRAGFAINNYGELRSWGLDIVYEFNR